MKSLFMAAFAVLFLATPALAKDHVAAKIGEAAPEFTATDSISGEEIKLSDLKGKIVVLEWTNHQCPFVRKHYDSGNMQKLQKEATDHGVVWISIISSADGKEGFLTPEQSNELLKKEEAHPTYKLLDSTGAIGHMYGAKTTPHMYVIDQNGVLAYMGAIDSDNSFKPDAIAGATNYVQAALSDLEAGKPVATPETNPYGCGVKY